MSATAIRTTVDNETDTLSSVDARVPQLPEVVSHLARRKPTRQHAGHDCVTVFDHLCVACHGLSVLDTIFLSQWHGDHSGGLPAAIEAIAAARSAAGIADPVVVDGHPDRPDQRGIQSPGGTFVMLPQETTLAAHDCAADMGRATIALLTVYTAASMKP